MDANERAKQIVAKMARKSVKKSSLRKGRIIFTDSGAGARTPNFINSKKTISKLLQLSTQKETA